MTTALSARRPCAGAVPGRGGACLAVETPAAPFTLESNRQSPLLLLPRRGGEVRVLRPLGPPLLRLLRPVRRGVQLDQPVEGLGDAPVGLRRDGLLAGLHPL